MQYANLLIELNGAVAWVTVNRPDKLNALNRATLTELQSAFDALRADAQVRVIVLTGAGPKAFVAGADIAEMRGLNAIEARDFSKLGQDLMLSIEQCGKPVIAMINGFALGGGLELAMACAIRVAGDNARMGQPEVNLGLIPGFGGSQRLVRLCGKAVALDLCLSGQPIDAARALAVNLVTRVFPADSLRAETAKLAEHIAGLAPLALRGVLDCVRYGAEAPLDAGLDYESQSFGLLFASEDMRAGTAAFLERKPAVFNGR